ncbi:ABC transporter permease [Parasedimentitalea psychrophila]|uniref:ABC transporter permease n=1 Tax=Parasedimentitalea psychrophila TaxID=2997337 RepID=A0A9Y2KY93_9RHOB|nr:ABC transporter permease [Parasedimentitalea psychrophila]WIY24654.1 ABC transporter permease [Parasedimentitalea psychrophila]
MIRAALGALLSHWRCHPLQLLTLVAGLALATGLWSAVQAINGEARASYGRASAQLGLSGMDILIPKTGTIPMTRYVMLRRAGWKLAPVIEGRWSLRNGSVKLLGIDPLNHPALRAISPIEAPQLDALSSPGRLFLHPSTQSQLDGHPDLPPVTHTENLPTGVVLSDISLAEALLGLHGQITRLIILADQPMGLKPLAELAPELLRRAAVDTETGRLTDSFHLNLTAFGLLSFAVGLFIVQGTVGLGIEQRRNLFRTLRAMGVSLRLLTGLLIGELMVIALAAGGLGLILGYLVAGALLPDVSATLNGLYGETVEGGITLRASWIMSGLGMAIFGTLIASAQAFANFYRMPLLLAPGVQARSLDARSSQQVMAIAGCGLIVAGSLAILLIDGLVAGFALLAGVMLGSALLLPLLLFAILSAGARTARSALSEWIWADMRAQLPGISLAMMALLLALATNIGVGTMTSSFRLTFVGWMNQRLSAEIYATVKDEQQAGEFTDWLADRDITTLPIRWAEVSYDGAPIRIYGVIDHDTYRENWPVLQAQPAAWDKVFDGVGVMINEQLARRQNLWPGDMLTLTQDWQIPVTGVYSDYGNPHGQAIISLPSLLQRVPDVPNRQFGLRLPPKDASDLIKEIRQSFDSASISVIDQADIKARSLAVFDRTFVVTGALNLLTLGVAGFAILTSLLTLWTMRLPQLAPIWALGVSRRQLAWLEVLRSLALATLTAFLALPLGLVLAWVLLSVINVEAFGWKLPMYVFPMDWLRLLGLALIAAAAAAAVPAIKLARIKPADLLKVFAHER